MSTAQPGKHAHHDNQWLPDFCSLPVLGAFMLVAQVLVLVLVLAPGKDHSNLGAELVAGTAYVQWLALCNVVVLCRVRPRLVHLPVQPAIGAAFGLVLAITAAGSALVFWVDQVLGFGLTLPPEEFGRFVFSNTALVALLAAATFRYFYVSAQWQRQVKAQAKAQVAALQARIRPHFLFNSMNTIASLIRTSPARAENAVEDLAELFRAALSAGEAPSTLEAEIELVKRYLDIESLRLGERLTVEWSVDCLPLDLQVPSLMIQPLVENAIHHGIQPLANGGTISIRATCHPDRIVLTVHNPKPRDPPPKLQMGNHIALDNIRQRLAYQFGDRAKLEVEPGADYYAARLTLPRP
jgi:two-component system sensor histidine kinase AlgZ